MEIDIMSETDRRHLAKDALSGLDVNAEEHLRLVIRCPRSHNVAFVYDTDQGLVYRAVNGRHAGDARAGRPSGLDGHLESDFVVFVAATPAQGDILPAWCECGPHSVSRQTVQNLIRADCHVLRLR